MISLQGWRDVFVFEFQLDQYFLSCLSAYAGHACKRRDILIGGNPVQVIGTKFVLFKRNPNEPKIELVKEKKKA